MKSKLKKKASILIILGIFCAISSIYYSNPCLKATSKDKSTDYSDYFTLDKENLKISVVSGKIHIDNNWTAAKSAGICTGNGTYSDPYVIEDLEIDGEDSGSCILIENSNVFFRIENCKFYNSGDYPTAGIMLNNTNNGHLIDNDCSNNFSGIYLRNSNNNTISGNIASYNNYTGIYFSVGDYNTVSDNTACYNGNHGVHLLNGAYNNISGNTLSYNYLDGIRLWFLTCHDNNISRNIISKNSWCGVNIIDGDDNNIYLNCFIENGRNAKDDGSNNRWDNGTMGNYWSNFTGLDADGDGIGDVPHNITGSAGSQDNFPLMKCPLPVQVDNGDVIPLELIILISVISGVAVIGVATLLLIIRKRKSIE